MGVAKGNVANTGNQMGAGIIRATDMKLPLTNIVGYSPWYQRFHTFKMQWTPGQSCVRVMQTLQLLRLDILTVYGSKNLF